MKKTILVLANSIKKGGRCVAGIEILNADRFNPTFGDFIRPIDQTHDEGTLEFATTLLGSALSKPLDVVEIDFDGHANDPVHPEDWVISKLPWRKEGSYQKPILKKLPQAIVDEWGPRNYVVAGEQESTLQLIRLKEERKVTSGHFHNEYTGQSQFKNRLRLPGRGYDYNCSITDPFFVSLHSLNPRNISEDQTKETSLPRCTYILMSLTPPFTPSNTNEARQYKIIASIIEPDA